MDAEQWRRRLAAGHWFSHLPGAFQHSLLAHARLRLLTAGQCLFKRGDPPCGLYAVLDGSLRISAVNEQGKEALLSLVESPYWFGEICLFDGLPRTHDACAGRAVHAVAGAPAGDCSTFSMKPRSTGATWPC